MSRASRAGARRYSRLDRVNQALREVIADELERIDDVRLELVTITGTSVDPDLRRARVWYSALSSPATDDDVEAALAQFRVRMQAAVGRQMRLKRTPELDFKLDPAIAVGSRVEDILRELKTRPELSDKAEPESSSGPPEDGS